MSDFFGETLFPAVAKAAPILAGALGGPAAGLAVGLIANLFGADPKNTDDIIQKMSQDPNATIKLKELELQNIKELKALDSKNFQMEVEDRKDAREKNNPFYCQFMKHMAYFITIGFFGALFLLFFPQVNLNSEEKQILSLLIGMLASKWQTIIDFFYGGVASK